MWGRGWARFGVRPARKSLSSGSSPALRAGRIPHFELRVVELEAQVAQVFPVGLALLFTDRARAEAPPRPWLGQDSRGAGLSAQAG